MHERHRRQPQPGAVAGGHLNDPPVGRCAGLGDEPHRRARPEQHREHLEQRPGIVVARQHDRRGDRAEFVERVERQPQVGGGGPQSVEDVAGMDDQIRLGGAGLGDDLGQDGFVVGRAADAPQRLSDVPVGGMEQAGHLRAPRARRPASAR